MAPTLHALPSEGRQVELPHLKVCVSIGVWGRGAGAGVRACGCGGKGERVMVSKGV